MKTTFPVKFRKEPKNDEAGYDAFDVATLNVSIDVKSIVIDGESMVDETIKYLIGYGIKQTLQDSYAAKQDRAAAIKVFDAKFARLVNGEFEFDGENGRSADPVRAEMRKLAELAVTRDTELSMAQFVKKYDAKKWRAAVNAYMAANEAEYRKSAESIVATRRGDAADSGKVDLSSILAA